MKRHDACTGGCLLASPPAACKFQPRGPKPRLSLRTACRSALRGVVARAQAANDERLLASPYLQLKAMLGLGSVQLEAL